MQQAEMNQLKIVSDTAFKNGNVYFKEQSWVSQL